MRTVAIIQARKGSTRLPGKVFADICGYPMLWHVVQRVKAIPNVDAVGLTIPHRDLPPFNAQPWLDGIWIGCRDEADVLGGYASLAREMDAAIVIRITADCPLIAPELCADLLEGLRAAKVDYATNDTTRSGYPDGLDCQICTMEILSRAHRWATFPSDREHVCPWMEREPGVMRLLHQIPENERESWPKFSVDTQDDLDLVRRIMARIPAGNYSWQATAEAIRAELSEKS